MASSDDVTVKYKLDIGDFNSKLQDVNSRLKENRAEWNKQASETKNWGTSVEGVKAKLTSLKSELALQVEKLDTLKAKLQAAKEAYGTNGKSVDELKAKLQALKSQGVSETSAEYQAYQKQLLKAEAAQESSGKTIQSLNIQITSQQATVNKTQNSIDTYTKKLDEVQKASEKAGRSTTQLKDKIKEQETALEDLKDKYASVVISQGKDSDQAVSLAAQITALTEELDKNKSTLQEGQKSAESFATAEKKTGESGSQAKTGIQSLQVAIGNLASKAVEVAIEKIKELGEKIVDLGKESIENAEKHEALAGSVKTLYGTSAQALEKYADKAYSTAQMSANDYLSTATSFAASLIQGCGGDMNKAVTLTNQAITDMSDNSTKMGTDIESIRNAYQGFAKDNFTINLMSA